jgi:ribonuclease BN (tRNA processing enzyme)
MRIIPLGTNGFFPSHNRQTMCALLIDGDQVVALDAGSGLGRLMEAQVRELVAGRERLDIVLSHYHLDHVIGLSYLPAVWPRGRVRIFAPAPPLVQGDPETAFGKLLGPPLFGATVEELSESVEIVPVTEEELEVGHLRFRLRRQAHPGGSVGMRIGDDLAYLTDTVIDEQAAELARGVRLLIHELWLTESEAAQTPAATMGHSDVAGVGRLAAAASVEKLMFVHHHPKRSRSEVEAIADSLRHMGNFEVMLPEEGRAYEL